MGGRKGTAGKGFRNGSGMKSPKCKQLGAAGRDKETDEKLKEILDHMQSGDATFATIVPLYIKNINFCVDRMYEDLENVSKMLNGAKK